MTGRPILELSFSKGEDARRGIRLGSGAKAWS